MSKPDSKHKPGNPRPNEMDPRYFHMWRGLVAMVHAPELTREERQFLKEELKGVTMAEWQRSRLELDMYEPQNLDEILPEIENVEDLEALMGLSIRLFYSDGVITPEEQAIMNRLEVMLEKHLEAEQLQRDIQKKYEIKPNKPEEDHTARVMAATRRLVGMACEFAP